MYSPQSFTPDNSSVPAGAYKPQTFAPDSTQQQTPTQSQPQQKLPGWLHVLFPMLTGGLGGFLGSAGGIAAGALVPGADLTGVPEAAAGYAGAVGGAGAGTALGQGAINGVEKMMGGAAPANMSGQLNSMKNAGIAGGAAEAIGIPVAKGLGYIAHPIAPFINSVNQTLADSPENIDFSKLFQNYQQNELPNLARQAKGPDVNSSYEALRNYLSNDVIPAYQPHLSPSGNTPVDVNSLNVPVADANLIKRALTSGADYGNPNKNIENLNRIKLSSYLKTAIEQAVPQVKTPNTIAHNLYNVQDAVPQLVKAFPFIGRLIDKTGGLAIPAAQKAIPANGGYLQQLFSILGIGAGNQEAGAYNNQ